MHALIMTNLYIEHAQCHVALGRTYEVPLGTLQHWVSLFHFQFDLQSLIEHLYHLRPSSEAGRLLTM